jgi:hypothetical protein
VSWGIGWCAYRVWTTGAWRCWWTPRCVSVARTRRADSGPDPPKQGRRSVLAERGRVRPHVRDLGEFCREIRYVHHSPVERELVREPEDWKWSSVRWWGGEREGEIECDPPPPWGATEDPEFWKRWKGYK